MGALAQFPYTRGNLWCLAFCEELDRGSKNFDSLEKALTIKRNTIPDRAAAIIFDALSSAHEFSQTHATRWTLSTIEPIIEGCFYEAERLLCSGKLSPPSRDKLKYAFTQHDDSDRLKRVLEHALVRWNTWDARSLRLGLKGLLCGGSARYGFRDGIRGLKFFRSNLGHALSSWYYLARHFISDLRNVAPHPSNQIMQDETHDALTRASLAYPARLQAERERGTLKGNDHPNLVVECDAWMLARCRLVLQAIAIQEHEETSGKLPESLSEVELFIDPYSGEPFLFDKLDKGFRLSSAGPGLPMTPSLARTKDVLFYPISKKLVLTIVPGAKLHVDYRPLGLVATHTACMWWKVDNEAQCWAECWGDEDEDIGCLPASE